MYTFPLVIAAMACSSDLPGPPADAAAQAPLHAEVIDALSMERVRDDVELLAADERGGRVPGSPGHAFTRDYLAAEMALAGLEPVAADFVLQHDLHLDRDRRGLDAKGALYDVPLDQPGYNLLGIHPGTDSEEVVLLVAHYDHLGMSADGEAFNGAFDDIAAVAALLELARVLNEQDVRLARSIGFLFTDAEEDGLDGAEAWVTDPTFALTDIVAALSVDPIGRGLLTDAMPLFAIGAERSPEILDALGTIAPFVDTPFHHANRQPLLGYASDQDAFWGAPSAVPALWITSGGMAFYHTVDDTPETIDYRSVQTHLASIGQLAAHLANTDVRPTDIGAQDLSLADLEQAISVLEIVLQSSELDADDQAIGTDFLDLFSAGVAAGTAEPPQYLTGYTEMFFYVINDLTPSHPGPIPPPFPE